ncbi:amine oxidase [Stylonychia lemnae]|uniref:Amine oxidase n=1 Tax=Stylonychia lemnae TaxID=5949 RepID=A0A078A9D5_STYLE|nr:amine oxidase [Stylonychia lemnae]|eukprot:CDW77393.1 amine oxidase [Stylonychia lemnae]
MKFHKFTKSSFSQVNHYLNQLIVISICLILIEEKVLSKEVYCKDRVIIVGAGISGLAAGQKLQNAGCDVTILEASLRVGGRIQSVMIGKDVMIDLGASWIGGTGKGTQSKSKWDDQYNPIYQIALNNNITTIASLDFDEGANQVFYTQKIGELDICQNDLNQYFEIFKDHLRSHLPLASDQTSLEDIFQDFTVKDEKYNQKFLKNFTQSFIYAFKNAADSDQLSARYVVSKQKFVGKDHVIKGGFQQITDELSKELKVLRNKQVVEVDYLNELITVKTSDGEIFSADKVIVSVPLGILKSKEIHFNPPLSLSKQESIERLGSGIMDKLFLEFDKVFWDQDSVWFNYISDSDYKWIITANLFKYTDKPILMMFNIGRDAIAFSEQSDENVLASAMQTLRILYPNAPNYVNYKRTNWGHDKFTKMAFSYMQVGSNSQDPINIAASIDKKVYFAGEHTTFDFLGTAHGAYISGMDAAQAILDDQ